MTKSKEADEIEKAWTERLVMEDWNLFVTFTFKEEISPRQILADFGNFTVDLRKHLHGKNSRKRMAMFPVIEGELPGDKQFVQRRHVHLLMKTKGSLEQTRDLLRRLWIGSGKDCGDPEIASDESDPDGWCSEITTAEEKLQKIRYILKQAKFNQERIMTKYTSFVGFGI